MSQAKTAAPTPDTPAPQLPEGLPGAIVMNPPFHEGKHADVLIGLKFIAAAAQALGEPEGFVRRDAVVGRGCCCDYSWLA